MLESSTSRADYFARVGDNAIALSRAIERGEQQDADALRAYACLFADACAVCQLLAREAGKPADAGRSPRVVGGFRRAAWISGG